MLEAVLPEALVVLGGGPEEISVAFFSVLDVTAFVAFFIWPIELPFSIHLIPFPGALILPPVAPEVEPFPF